MKNKILLVLALLLSSTAIFAQPQRAQWKTKVNMIDEKIFDVVVTAQIDSSWHVYDTTRTELGPPATIIDFTIKNGGAEKVGGLQVSQAPHKFFDDVFMMEIGYYEGTVSFTQRFNLLKESADFKIYVEWMTCDDTNCSPLADTEFNFSVPTEMAEILPGYEDEVAVAEVKPVDVSTTGNLWAMIIEAFIWGLVALLTPCIFPMVPMTVSFFMKGSPDPRTGRRRAFLYGFFIVLLYTLPIAALILITRIFGGDAVTVDIFNWLATNWLPNIIFFIVFIVFALSFFGLFEITLPSSLTTKTDSRADTKGLGGIFFMALTLVLVSFSCTGPIVGTVVIQSISGEFWTPIVTMLVFSIAFAFPFTLLAMFPSLLSKMPKSGGWLASVKVVLGFVETALAFKFLSMADQAYHWNILPRDIYLVIWIVIATGLVLFMLNLIPFKGVDKFQKWGPVRLVFTLIAVLFDAYLISGLFGAPLQALSGYLPPQQEKGWFYDNSVAHEMDGYDVSTVKYGDKLKLSNGINGFFELKQAQEFAEKAGKPLFIDFTGHACVNCREMEQRVWSDPRVLEILRNDYIVVALYCDDKMSVPEEEWIKDDSGRTLKTLGKINSFIAYKQYGVNAQPCYILEGKGGRLLADPRGYDLDVEAFIQFLETGKQNY